jgi:hypothetical protein
MTVERVAALVRTWLTRCLAASTKTKEIWLIIGLREREREIWLIHIEQARNAVGIY